MEKRRGNRHARSYASVHRVARMYGLDVVSIRPCSTHYRQNASFCVETQQGTVLVKPYVGTMAGLKRLSVRLHTIGSRGFTRLPQWHRTETGLRWSRLNNRLYYVTDWIDGELLGQQPRDLRKLGSVLGKLHNCQPEAAHSKPISNHKAVLEMENLWKQAKGFEARLKSVRSFDSRIGLWFGQNGDSCLKLAAIARETLHGELRSALRHELNKCTWTHGDVTRPNVIQNAHGVYLIDWEACKLGLSLYELAKAIANTTSFRIELMQSMIQGYERVRPLSIKQKRILVELFRLPREAWHVARSVSHGQLPQGFEVLQGSWNERLEAIRWLDDWVK